MRLGKCLGSSVSFHVAKYTVNIETKRPHTYLLSWYTCEVRMSGLGGVLYLVLGLR